MITEAAGTTGGEAATQKIQKSHSWAWNTSSTHCILTRFTTRPVLLRSFIPRLVSGLPFTMETMEECGPLITHKLVLAQTNRYQVCLGTNSMARGFQTLALTGLLRRLQR